MRVIVDVRPWCEPNRSGVGTYAAEITKALLARREHEYALFANGAALVPPADLPAGADARFTRYPNKLLNASIALARRPFAETLAARDGAPAADFAFFPNFGFFSTRLPYAVTVHDLSFVRSPRFFSPKQRLWHALVRPAETLARAAFVVAVSEHTRRDVLEIYGVPAERAIVATPAVDARFTPQSAEVVAALRTRLNLQRPFFLFLGNVEPRKNVLGIITAFEFAMRSKSLAEHDLVIAGGSGYGSDEVRRRAALSPVANCIRFLGYVPDTDKPALYTAAAAFVYPSFYEGFGIPALEAMACGTPVVASRTSSLGEVVGDGGLLVDPYRPEDIAEAMIAVATDVRLRADLRQRGLARTRLFSWHASAANISAAIEKALH